jgi:hypothetical protein
MINAFQPPESAFPIRITVRQFFAGVVVSDRRRSQCRSQPSNCLILEKKSSPDLTFSPPPPPPGVATTSIVGYETPTEQAAGARVDALRQQALNSPRRGGRSRAWRGSESASPTAACPVHRHVVTVAGGSAIPDPEQPRISRDPSLGKLPGWGQRSGADAFFELKLFRATNWPDDGGMYRCSSHLSILKFIEKWATRAAKRVRTCIWVSGYGLQSQLCKTSSVQQLLTS